MKKTFEFIGGLIILIFMVVVLWKVIGVNSTEQIITPTGDFACTMDAKICPDGSAVGRTGPNCEFSPCPNTPPSTVDSFEDCVAAGNPVMESYPRQCNHEGKNFVEDIDETVACTMDAKICPDGSAVGRVGPNCEFAECPAPAAESEVTVCSPESKLVDACTMDYRPVCGLVEIQCITTPCNPVPQTFGNACGACSQGNVISYTRGECR